MQTQHKAVMENLTAWKKPLDIENNRSGFPHQLNDLNLNLNDISNILAYSVMSIGKLYILDKFLIYISVLPSFQLKLITPLGSNICSETSWLFLNMIETFGNKSEWLYGYIAMHFWEVTKNTIYNMHKDS